MSKRINKTINQWTVDELIGWAKGEVIAGRNTTENQLAGALAKKLNIEVNKDLDVFKAEAVKAAEEAEETMAPESEEQATSTAEEAEAAEEPDAPASESEEGSDEPAPAPPEEESKPEPEPAPEKETPKTPTQPRGQTTTTQQVDESPFAGGQKSTSLMIVEDNLAKYVEKMKPGVSHQGNEGPATQVMLYRTIQTILRQKGGDFNFLFGEFLKTVHKHRNGPFNERYLFRYMDRMSLTNSERRNFERFMNLALTVADPATRSHTLKQVDIDATMEGFKDADAHQKVVAFFQV